MLIRGADNRLYHTEEKTRNPYRRVTFKHRSKEYSVRQLNRDLRRMQYIQEHRLVKQDENK